MRNRERWRIASTVKRIQKSNKTENSTRPCREKPGRVRFYACVYFPNRAKNSFLAAGVEVQAKGYDDAFHAFPTLGHMIPESEEVLQNTIAFIRAHI